MLEKSPSPRPVGRPRSHEKRDAILDAGWEMFLAQGFQGTALDAIARAAGVSRVTLYSHFPDKDALFEAAVRREMGRIEGAQTGRPMEQPLAETLVAFGVGLMEYLTSPPAVDFYSVLAGELRRHPDLARRFYELGPGATHANLTAIIADAADRNELTAPDPAQAAEHLIGLWQGLSNFQLALDIEAESLRIAIHSRVQDAVQRFLAAYNAVI